MEAVHRALWAVLEAWCPARPDAVSGAASTALDAANSAGKAVMGAESAAWDATKGAYNAVTGAYDAGAPNFTKDNEEFG